MSQPNLRTGTQAAKEASKRGSGFSRTPYLRLQDGETQTIRFFQNPDEGWITVLMHQMVPTKPAPDKYQGEWPKSMGAVCRYDPAFSGVYEDCYICDNLVDEKKVRKPSGRTWALAVLREEAKDSDGRRVFLDMRREETIPAKDGQPEQKREVLDVRILQFGYQNFFSQLDSFYGLYETLTDRDYRIKRVGTQLDTQYQIAPWDPIEIEGVRFDPTNEIFAEEYANIGVNLSDLVIAQSSDEYYGRFFDPRVTASEEGNVGEADDSNVPPKPSNEVSEERLQELANRVRENAAKQAASASAE